MSYYQTIFQLKYVKHTPPLTRDPILADLIDKKKSVESIRDSAKKYYWLLLENQTQKNSGGLGGIGWKVQLLRLL